MFGDNDGTLIKQSECKKQLHTPLTAEEFMAKLDRLELAVDVMVNELPVLYVQQYRRREPTHFEMLCRRCSFLCKTVCMFQRKIGRIRN